MASIADVRAKIARGTPDPVYLLLVDDDAEISRLAADIAATVDDELRAFNVERIYAGEKGVTAASIAESARMLPMMSDRRIVVVLRGEKLLKPKRRATTSSSNTPRSDGRPTWRRSPPSTARSSSRWRLPSARRA